MSARHASRHSSRQPSRGGIQKRNATPVRVDKDGDLMMDANGASTRAGRSGSGRATAGAARSSHGRGGASSLSSRVSSRASRGGLDANAIQKAVLRGMGTHDSAVKAPRSSVRDRASARDSREGLQQIEVIGLKRSKAATNKDGGISDLVAFLERKATNPDAPAREAVRIKKSRMEGDAMVVSVRPDDADKILRLNHFTFAGTTLDIKRAKEESEETPKTVEILKAFLGRRYDVDAKFLNLSQMPNDAELVALGVFNTTSRESKFFPALMKICETTFSTQQERDEAVVSVSLSGNNLPNVSSMTALAQTFPLIRNLDLSENNIPNMKALEGWRWRFKKLDHLIIQGNPIETNDPNYKDEVLRWYSTLTKLNSVTVRTPEEVKAASTIRLPLPTLGPRFRDEAGIGENFVKQFFAGFDADRPKLVETFYDDRSKFSLSVNTSAPRGDADGTQSQTASWDNYIKRSRNLVKINHAPAQVSRLYEGVISIKECFTTLPPTRHVDLLAEPQKWCIECHAIPNLPDPTGQAVTGVGGLLITGHSEFAEMDVSTNSAKAIRSFDRTITLGPGTGAAGVVVLSDILIVRAHGGHSAWQAETPAASASALPAVEEQKRREAIAMELSKATGMTLEYSAMCLDQSAWNLEGAAANFQQAKANLPPEAFVQQ